MMPSLGKEPKKRKVIRIHVYNQVLDIDHTDEKEVIEVTHSVKNVKLIDNELVIEIYNPELNEVYTKKITLDVKF